MNSLENIGSYDKSCPSLAGMTKQELSSALKSVNVPERENKMRVNQLWHWIYFQGLSDFQNMLNVSKSLRQTLSESFTLNIPEIVEEQISIDGTRKWLIKLVSLPFRGKNII